MQSRGVSFGPLIYGPEQWRTEFASHVFSALDFPVPKAIVIWLWRRVPHPETQHQRVDPRLILASSPRTALSERQNGTLPWVPVRALQGIEAGQDLRIAHWDEIGKRAIPSVQKWAILGVGEKGDVLKASSSGTTVLNLTWRDLLNFMPASLKPELKGYLSWKETYSTKRSPRRY